MYLLDDLIGVVIGGVVGLTGAGGSLLSIPIFVHFFDMTIKEATLYSLIVEIIACFTSFSFQRNFSKNKIGIVLAGYSLIGSFLASPIKQYLSNEAILGLYLAVCIYSIYEMWVTKKVKVSFVERLSLNKKSIGVGFTLGMLTTFTGLGGGVLIVPALLGFFLLSQKEAVATSLLTIGLSAGASLFAQMMVGSRVHLDLRLLSLCAGIVVGGVLIELVMKALNKSFIIFLRRLVFTLVIVGSVLKMIV